MILPFRRPGAGPVRRAVALNIAGTAIPGLIAVLAVAPLASALGPARLGILTLVWATSNYLSLFHFGVGRALTQAAAGTFGSAREREVREIFLAGLGTTLLLGCLAGAGLAALAPAIVHAVNVPAALAGETVAVFRLLALVIPFVVSTSVLSGLLQARLMFGRTTVVTTCASILSYLGPLVVLRLGGGLVEVVSVVLLGRVAAWLAYLVMCLRLLPGLSARGLVPRPRFVRELLWFGGWTTVSSVLSPMMVYADRFLIGGVLSLAAVGYYALVQEIMLRIGLLSTAVAGVLFPAFAAATAQGEASVRRLLNRGVLTVFGMIFPIVGLCAAVGADALSRWLGVDYGENARAVVAWFAVGLLANGVAKVAAALVEGSGRPDICARFHLAEILPYVVALVLLVRWKGIEGAAIAWTARAALDAALLFGAVVGLYPHLRATAIRTAMAAGAAAALIAVLQMVPSPGVRVVLVAGAAAIAAAVVVRAGTYGRGYGWGTAF